MEQFDIVIIREKEIGERRHDFEMFLIEESLDLQEDQFITLPLRKVKKLVSDPTGKPVVVFETEVNVKKSIRIIQFV